MSAQVQMQIRIKRYTAEAGHVADMLKIVPFAPEMVGAIRAAWDPEKASGPHRRLLLSLCQALAPYLHTYPEFIALFDEIPEFASEFSKAVLGCGVSRRSGSSTRCDSCKNSISTTNTGLREEKPIYCPIRTLMGLNRSFERWFCSIDCYKNMACTRVEHDLCEICIREEMED